MKRPIRSAALVALLVHLLAAGLADAESGAAPSGVPDAAPDTDVSDVQSDDEEEWDDDDFFDDFDSDFDASPTSFPDPLEGLNRKIFAFNLFLDKWVLDPVTQAYSFVMPRILKRSVRSFFDNLYSFPVIANDSFQLEWRDACIATGRLVVNSTLGIGGLFDPASDLGLDYHESDFGQTLTLAGVPSGPYLIVPALGPTNFRDGAGVVVDTFFNPPSYILGRLDLIFIGSGSGLATREEHFEELKALEASSVDFYATLRSAYYQSRQGYIWERREDRRPAEQVVDENGPLAAREATTGDEAD